MKKKYLAVVVTRNDDTTFRNPLKLSEAHIISQLARQNKSVTVRCVECLLEDYKCIFGK